MLNKVKGVKIEQEDGTLSDIIPIRSRSRKCWNSWRVFR